MYAMCILTMGDGLLAFETTSWRYNLQTRPVSAVLKESERH